MNRSMKLVLAAAALVSLAGIGQAYAAGSATQTITASVAFDTPLAISGTATMNFGTVKAGTVETYVLSPAGALSAGTTANILYGTPAATSLTVTGSTTQAISITANNYTANGGVTPSAATCNYDSGGAAACSTLTTVAAPGAGKTLLVGASLTTGGSETAGSTATPTFDIVVTYN